MPVVHHIVADAAVVVGEGVRNIASETIATGMMAAVAVDTVADDDTMMVVDSSSSSSVVADESMRECWWAAQHQNQTLRQMKLRQTVRPQRLMECPHARFDQLLFV